ncbi:hypothetical protein [Halocatena marina]|uniref:Uncharacterized protein n=1 Tax=Halocatena marina TaxID=2934937 RepID=A0ABD5YN95_9EURY|nr:hypothetical protein [Halocatena marina]
MKIKSAYRSIDNWIRSFSTSQYALLVWLVGVSVGTLAGLALPGNNLVNSATHAMGAATGVAIVFYLAGMPEN